MRAVVVGLLLTAGCYGPSAPAGVSCATSLACPAGQTCDQTTLVCVGPGGSVPDAPAIVVDSPDPVDSPPADAAIDGPATVTRTHWGQIRRLSEINSTSDDTDPTITSDGLEIYFASDRHLAGTHDLYRVTRPSLSEPFGNPIQLTSIQSGKDDRGTDISEDRRSLYFTRADGATTTVKRGHRTTDNGTFTVDDAGDLSAEGADFNPATCNNEAFAFVDHDAGLLAGEIFQYVAGPGEPGRHWNLDHQLEALSSPGDDGGVSATKDCLQLVFHSDRSGTTHLYASHRTSVTSALSTPELITELAAVGQTQARADTNGDGTIIIFDADGDLYEARAIP